MDDQRHECDSPTPSTSSWTLLSASSSTSIASFQFPDVRKASSPSRRTGPSKTVRIRSTCNRVREAGEGRPHLRGGYQEMNNDRRQIMYVEPQIDPASGNNKSLSRQISPRPSPKGFMNVGNTCYANAALQCLLSTALATALTNPRSAAIFRRYSSNPNILAQGSGSVDSNEDVVKEKRRSYDRRMRENCRWLTKELRAITCEYNAPHTSWFTRPIVNPGSITRHPHRLSPCLSPYQQEDAHEFLRALLSTLVMNGQNRRLSSLFDGLLESAVTCLHCHRPSLTRDRYMDLSLDICGTHVNNLNDALEEFTKTETLSGENKVFCQKCGTKRTATKGLRLATAPSILVCHLKRFAFDSYGRLIRLDKKIYIPLILELGGYMSCLNKARPPPYELVAVLVHQGQTCDSGHYLAYIKNNDQWYKCNDSVVEAVSVDTVLSQQAYMVLYEVEKMRSSHSSGSHLPSTTTTATTPWSSWRDLLQSSCGVDESFFVDICWHRPPKTPSSPTAHHRLKPRNAHDRSIDSHCSHDDLSTLGESSATVDSSQPETWRRIASSGDLNSHKRMWKEALPCLGASNRNPHNNSCHLLPPRPTAPPSHQRINSNSAYWDSHSGDGLKTSSTGRLSYSPI